MGSIKVVDFVLVGVNFGRLEQKYTSSVFVKAFQRDVGPDKKKYRFKIMFLFDQNLTEN